MQRKRWCYLALQASSGIRAARLTPRSSGVTQRRAPGPVRLRDIALCLCTQRPIGASHAFFATGAGCLVPAHKATFPS